jgi:four helix bundle protein
MRDYTRIKAWELADDLAVEVYRTTATFPPDEKYALTSQVRRAAYSVAANIAEGTGRRTTKNFVRFLDMAKGSANETQYFCHLAHRLNYMNDTEYISLKEQVDAVSKCLASYIRAVEQDV